MPSRLWRTIFAVEIVVCAATCVSWLVAPGFYLRGILAKTPSFADFVLLQQGSIVVFCAYVYLYARLLWARSFHLPSFVALQEAMAIGDVLVLALSVAEATNLSPAPGPFAAQVLFAAAWLAIRVTFLVSARRSNSSSVRGASAHP